MSFDVVTNQGYSVRPIQGMESVIATVSGYHGTERFKLIKLIAQTGASYVGSMDKFTTHLVCWQFEGKKFSLARHLGTYVISHRWFEDCLAQGKRLPEGPYTMLSGQEVGPISWELPAVLDTRAKEKAILEKKRTALSDLSNASGFNDDVDSGAGCSDLTWRNQSDILLSNELEPSSSSSLVRSLSNKRNFCDASGKGISSGRTHRSCRLTKKRASDNSLDVVMLQTHLSESHNLHKDSNPGGVDLGFFSSIIEPSAQGLTSEIASTGLEENGRGKFLRNEGIQTQISHYHINSNGSRNCELPGPSSLQEFVHISENKDCEHTQEDSTFFKNLRHELSEEAPLDAESRLSCVICWTDFSSTRGVLPCGHRFCYSCIQQWADCMASKGKSLTCPLCKSSFSYITKFEDTSSCDQKIYSQTIPCDVLNAEIFLLPSSRSNLNDNSPLNSACYECHNREPEDLLVCCRICQERWVHSCCLDPPLIPWTCVRCSDLRRLYQRFH